ncbi:MAG: hypothetical protein DLM52_09335 [Chthoniobacterales bacterium]|nr:MAG: hypothetical protein DLM52_09335 [Chthoniobacterales bacterium]
MPAGHISRSLDGSLCERRERELLPGPAEDTKRHTDLPCEGILRHTLLFRRAFSGVLVRCAGVATRQVVRDFVGFTSSVLPRATPNQTMQLTATRSAFTFPMATTSPLRFLRALGSRS